MNNLVITKHLKKPIHLSVLPRLRKSCCPIDGFYYEKLTVSAQMDFGEISFDIGVIAPEGGKACDLAIIQSTESPDLRKATIYIIIDYDAALSHIRRQLPQVKRLSNAGQNLIKLWIDERIEEVKKGYFLQFCK